MRFINLPREKKKKQNGNAKRKMRDKMNYQKLMSSRLGPLYFLLKFFKATKVN